MSQLSDQDSNTLKKVFEVENYLDYSKFFPTKSDNANTIHFTKPVDSPGSIIYVLACEQTLKVKIRAFRTFKMDPSSKNFILEIALPDVQKCRQAVEQGVKILGVHVFPQLPNGFPKPLSINVQNIPLDLTTGDLTAELQNLFQPFGTIVRIDSKIHEAHDRIFSTDGAVVYLSLAKSLADTSSLKSETWNRMVLLDFDRYQEMKLRELGKLSK